MDWITSKIAIGNIDDAVKLNTLRNSGISSVLCLNGWPNNAANTQGINWHCVELVDGFGNEVTRLQEAICLLDKLINDHSGSVLVHCMEGVSRSPLVVASYLADKNLRSFDECLCEVSSLRKWVSLQPGLFELRQSYELTIQPHLRLIPPNTSRIKPSY
jgi:protein-tyrosine phosphatase